MASRKALVLIRSARAGQPAGQLELGKLYLQGGEGLGRNLSSALLWLRRAAEQGQSEAWHLIGQHIPAEVVERPAELACWYVKAAEAGSVHAKRVLAGWLLKGAVGNLGDLRLDPLELLQAAASQGDPLAQFELGSALLVRIPGFSAATEQAVRWLEQAACGGVAHARRRLADYYWDSGDLEAARRWYQSCENCNDPEYCYRLGMLSLAAGHNGRELLERAAGCGHPAACHELGLRHALGLWGDHGGAGKHYRNYKKAVRWLEKAAERGSARACYALSSIYRHGDFALGDAVTARSWLLDAARRGSAEAQYDVALELWQQYLHRGIVPAAPEETDYHDTDVAAVKWLLRASRQGYLPASERLAELVVRVPAPDPRGHAAFEQTVRAMAQASPAVAMRLELAAALGLSRHEMLLLEPGRGDCGDCYVVDVAALYRRARRRIVLVERAEQREVIDRAKALFALADAIPGDVRGPYRYRYLRFWDLCQRQGVACEAFAPTQSSPTLHASPTPEETTVSAGAARADPGAQPKPLAGFLYGRQVVDSGLR